MVRRISSSSHSVYNEFNQKSMRKKRFSLWKLLSGLLFPRFFSISRGNCEWNGKVERQVVIAVCNWKGVVFSTPSSLFIFSFLLFSIFSYESLMMLLNITKYFYERASTRGIWYVFFFLLLENLMNKQDIPDTLYFLYLNFF